MSWAAWPLLLLLGAAASGVARAAPAACDRSRALLRGPRGRFSAGPPGANYTHDSHCQWLIQSNLDGGWITVMFTKLSTECSFDYVFVFDGPSPESPLLASFSGQSQPQNVTGHSGQMLVVLYSDTNYVLEGLEAEYLVAACPAACSGRGECAPDGRCVCHEGFHGPECAWPLAAATAAGQWAWVTRGDGLSGRAGHSAVYVAAADRLLVFGGHDLNSVLGRLQAFDFKSHSWLTLAEPEEERPAARFGHAAAPHPLGFAMHGGQLADGRLSHELWLYEAAAGAWSRRGLSCGGRRPPALARHSLTLGHHDHLYLFGGQTDDGHFSNQLWRITIGRTPEQDECQLVEARLGKQLDLRLAGHSTVFHPASQSLLVYGGLAASHARAAALSDRMYTYHVESRVWAEVVYPRGGAHVPLERAFHSATVVGEVLVVVGGYSQRHHRHETCHDAAAFLYHLHCHTWLEMASGGRLPGGGRFAHAAALRGGQLLVAGGYDGRVAADLLAWTPPPGGRAACGRLRGLADCTANPECGFCSADDTCHPRTAGANCTTNLQTTRCPGICPALSDCHSCLAVGNVSRGESVAVELRLGQCSWCVQSARCHPRDDKWGVCGGGEDTPSQAPGWWGAKGTELAHLAACTAADKRPGLTFLKYAHPANFSQPDFVSVVNSTSVEVSAAPGPEGVGGGETVARLRGFLRVSPAWRDDALCVCAAQAAALLRVAAAPGQPPAQVANLSTGETRRCARTSWPTGEPAKLAAGRLAIDLEARRPLLAASKLAAASVQLVHGHYCNQPFKNKVFTFESLEAWEGGECGVHSNCLQCVSDQGCGWCELEGGRCVSRALSERTACGRADGHWRFLTLRPAACPNCSDLTECGACASHALCEWWPHEALCTRRGRWKGAVVHAHHCPPQCHLRATCDACLSDAGPCVWCHSRQECFVFSAYTSQMQFGQCREWQDKAPCRSCSALSNCSSCLRTLGCGWCHGADSPIHGTCVSGDWTQPQPGSCPANSSWAFGECPDVDECALGLHECHPAATCRNTPGAYECACPQGFVGDGRRECRRTCPLECVNGRCGGAPHYQCACHLGWTGAACNLSCGCNGHASCGAGPGHCDECAHFTAGPTCGECLPGAFGDPGSADGCVPCHCNGHGEASKGLCKADSGHCFCSDHSEGPTCASCRRGFYGDPRDGGSCFRGCAPRALLSGLDPGSLGAADARPLDECLWVIWPLANMTQPPAVTIHLRLSELRVECGRNGVYLYDGLPSGGHLLAVACNNDSTLPLDVEAKSGLLSVYFHPGESGESFNASYEVLQCPDQCPSERRACVEGVCACADGWTGLGCLVAVCPANCSDRGLCDRHSGGCVCPKGWGGAACDTPLKNNLAFSTLFRAAALPDSLDHLRRTLPRFGHSVAADKRGGLWMFGGLSLALGPLNDIRLFDTKNATWMQVTVDSTREAALPAGRYFHAAAMVGSRRELYVHGGLGAARGPAEGPFGCRSTALRDLWAFSLKAHRWEQVGGGGRGPQPPPLAGHALVLRHTRGRPHQLLLVGGLEPCRGALPHVWSFDLDARTWTTLNVTGFWPPGVFGHSAVYHAATDAIYVFGGYEGARAHPSDKLYALHVGSRTWTLLPPFTEYNPPELLVPRARTLHSSVTTDDYLMVFGGRTHPYNSSDLLLAYSYACNLWVQLLPSELEVVGAAPPASVGQAMARDAEGGAAYVVGGLAGGALGRVTAVRAPHHLCALFARHKDACRGVKGCSFCSLRWHDGATDARCFPAGAADQSCDAVNATVSVNNGQVCDAAWLARRECGASRACAECLATWPAQAAPPCRWCGERCVGADDACGHASLGACRGACGAAGDCAACAALSGCAWREGACREGGADGGAARCAAPCAAHATCRACLGAGECAWATRTASCVAPSAAPLVCAGGACGLVLRGGGADRCPRPCAALTQCAACLRHARCGWCWTQAANASGQGFCADGSMDGADARLQCAGAARSWHYAECPPEDECANAHHDCDAVSERCVNLLHGYKCECNQGYQHDKVSGGCVPVCTKGCVHGRCAQPDKCECDFGFVGADCSLQCQCNGHSHCEGPAALDKCLKCLNNTEGAQCNRCKEHFVGSPAGNGRCVACADFCHGHSAQCVEASGGGGGGGAVCMGCANHTAGERCHECVRGHFRAADAARDACRPCECHGHGDACDPASGAHCNCRNNTESDAQCAAGARTGANGFPCWRLQCSRCKEYFTGTPTGGHACYRQMTVELEYCVGEACAAPEAGRVAFFAVQPRFMNVDIRLVVDVGGAGADVWLAPRDDALVVGGDGRVALDARLGNATLRDLPAHGLSTFATLGAAHALVVRALRHRLVVTLPQSAHDLAVARFYVALQARDAPLHGQLHFRQDQLHIDLFVFFSVFFSCFFLALAAGLLLWKAKQAADLRRARRRHVVEMLHLARRPFASAAVALGPTPGRPRHRHRRPKEVRPLAVEPTADGLAAVATVVVELPPGSVRLVLASGLVLMARRPS